MLTIQPKLENSRHARNKAKLSNNVSFGIRPYWWKGLILEETSKDTRSLFDKVLDLVKNNPTKKIFVKNLNNESVNFFKEKKHDQFFVTYKDGELVDKLTVITYPPSVSSRPGEEVISKYKFGDLNNSLQKYLNIILSDKSVNP